MHVKKFLKALWYFIWDDDSILSWIANVILAFLLVKFIIYPALGFMLSTSYPVVAVISSSMEHEGLGFDSWWEQNKNWYVANDLQQREVRGAMFHNGFSKGDIIILLGKRPAEINKLDVVVYASDSYKYPIIHRVVQIEDADSGIKFMTKGDNNPVPDPALVSDRQLLGKAVLRVPLLGWIKILFTEMIGGI